MFCGIDLGKTGCRLAVVDDRPTVVSADQGASLADDGTDDDVVDRAVRAVLAARAQLPTERRQLAGTVVCGVDGAGAAPELGTRLCTRLQAELPGTTVLLGSDLLITHAGALGGRRGTVAIVGTGAQVITVSDDGELTQFGNWGPWLGDDGSGAWIGREALRRVLASSEAGHDLGPLVAAAGARFGDLGQLPRTLAASSTPARTTAAFAADVLRLADDGEPAALDVVRSAAEDLTATIHRAGPGPVAVAGGVSGHPVFLDELAGALGQPVTAAEGTALDGALLLAGGDVTAPHLGALLRAASGPAAQTPPNPRLS